MEMEARTFEPNVFGILESLIYHGGRARCQRVTLPFYAGVTSAQRVNTFLYLLMCLGSYLTIAFDVVIGVRESRAE